MTAQGSDAVRESDLGAAGFVVRPADTPKRMAMVNRLPPNTFVSKRGNKTTYVYARSGRLQMSLRWNAAGPRASTKTLSKAGTGCKPSGQPDRLGATGRPWIADLNGPFGLNIDAF